MMNKKDFSIVCIGAGNVATHLAQALQQKGFHLSQISHKIKINKSFFQNKFINMII